MLKGHDPRSNTHDIRIFLRHAHNHLYFITKLSFRIEPPLYSRADSKHAPNHPPSRSPTGHNEQIGQSDANPQAHDNLTQRRRIPRRPSRPLPRTRIHSRPSSHAISSRNPPSSTTPGSNTATSARHQIQRHSSTPRTNSKSTSACVGFAEATKGAAGEHYNTCVYYHAATGLILARYRKIHLPGGFEPLPDPKAVNQFEKRYFLPGDLGFKAFRVPGLVEAHPSPPVNEEGKVQGDDPIFGMMICNDRRWSESWRAYGLQGVEVVLCGYNTNGFAPQFWGLSEGTMTREEGEALALFHHKLVMHAHSYTNATFSVCSARCGLDDGQFPLIGGSMIVDPEGRIVAESKTVGDEVVIADCDLDLCIPGKTRTFDFGRHRRTEHYGILVERTGIVEQAFDEALTSPSPSLHIQTVKGGCERKTYRILLINPSSTPSMTAKCLEMVRPTLPADVQVEGFTSPHPAPTAIEGSLDAVLLTTTAIRAILPIADQYDAFLVACYSDHPLTKALREELSAPVVGIMEASLYAARTLGGRFGIVVTSSRSEILHTDSIRNYGLEGFSVGVQSCGLGVVGLESKGEEVVLGAMCEAARELVKRGADVVTLGCAGMTKLKEAVEEAVGPDVQVIDGVVAGVHHLVGILRMGVRTAKKGVYASSKAGREARGQNYL